MVDKERKSTLFGSRLSSIFNAYSNEEEDRKPRSIKTEHVKKPTLAPNKPSFVPPHSNLTPDVNTKVDTLEVKHSNISDSSIFLTPVSSTTAPERQKPRRKPPPELSHEFELEPTLSKPSPGVNHEFGLESSLSKPETLTETQLVNDLNTMNPGTNSNDTNNALEYPVNLNLPDVELIPNSPSRSEYSPYIDESHGHEINALTSDINNLLFPENSSPKQVIDDGQSFLFYNEYNPKQESSDSDVNYPNNTTGLFSDFDDSNSNLSYFKNDNEPVTNSVLDSYPIDSPISGSYSQELSYDMYHPTNTEDLYAHLISSSNMSKVNESSDTFGSQNISTESKSSGNSVPLAPVDSASGLAMNTSQFTSIIPTPSSTSSQLFRSTIKPVDTFQSDLASSELNDLSSINKSAVKSLHKKSKSISSVWSASSIKNVNLATLKKTMDLKPGEGETSSYVLSIRKNAGTAYNESGPGKWKLPTGILPIDKSAASSNGKYMRYAGGISQARTKKASGVDLKHGHLQRRLLATEVDGSDDIVLGSNPLLTGTNSSLHTVTKSSGSSIVVPFSRTSSLRKSITGALSLNTNNESPLNTSTRRESIASVSSSSGSISDTNQRFGYYQHASYRDEEDEGYEDSLDMNEKCPLRTSNEYDDFPERERGGLQLANPDSDDEF